VPVTLALFAALVYGAADFFGGIASRRTPAATVVVLSQVAGAVVLAAAWSAFPGAGHFYPSDALWGMAAGIAGGAAIAALYAALAVGRMGVVSPIAAVVGASVPVMTGLILGERPPSLVLAGVVLAVVAVALVSANFGGDRGARRPDLAPTLTISFREPGFGGALLAGVLIGAVFVFLSRGHADGKFALLAVTRAVSVAFLCAYALVRRESLRPAPKSLGLILGAGALDMAANVLYVLATRTGMLAIVAVLTSLYPASTVFLARVVLNERLTRSQWAGVALAGLAVALIARGG
jgi:drug/metabolite transporter (DMT)-like permease